MLDGNGESYPPTRGHKLGKKENIREILWEQGGTQPGRGKVMNGAKYKA
jgi:hypothetical protein